MNAGAPMNTEQVIDAIQRAERVSYGRPISTAAHTRILARLRQARAERGSFSRRVALVTAVGLALVLSGSMARLPYDRAAAIAGALDADASVTFGDGGEEASIAASESTPGGPRVLP